MLPQRAAQLDSEPALCILKSMVRQLGRAVPELVEARTLVYERRRRQYPHICPTCKIAYDDQAQFTSDGEYAEIIRHSECGHVLMYRSQQTERSTEP